MDELRQWLTLLQVPRLGPATWQKISSRFTPAQLLSLSATALVDIGFSDAQINALHHPDERFIERCLAWCGPQRHIIPLDSAAYPELLRNIADPPLVLFVEGNPQQLSAPQIAMVGSRNASPAGKRHAIGFARELVDAGVIVTSGLAIGIDGYAHQGALQAGATVAVIGAGLECVYPKRHHGLARQIIHSNGCLVSELPPWFEAKAFQFPRRNRIISGLSVGVLVVEASLQSGSLITARLAAEQGRDVYAIPGAIGNPGIAGCHKLIKEGAKLVESVDDIRAEWPQFFSHAVEQQKQQTNNLSQSLPFSDLLDNVGDESTSVDQLAVTTGLSVETVLTQLLELELSGLIAAVPGGYIRMRG